jgi:hypothetical protein
MEAAEAVAVYGSAWSEADDGARLAILSRCWAPDGVYCDPSARVEGREALAKHIGGFQQTFAGHRIDAASGVDSHDGFFRFAWRMFGPDDAALLEGCDFGRLNADGQIELIVGFFGPWPSLD